MIIRIRWPHIPQDKGSVSLKPNPFFIDIKQSFSHHYYV